MLRFLAVFLITLVEIPIVSAKPTVVVTTTLIASAVQDVSGDAFEIVTLMPAGSCPGQFDLDPRQAAQVSQADLVIRHDMQGFLDRLFVAAGSKAESIVAPKGTFTVPSSYIAYCEKVAAELSKRNPALSSDFASHLAILKKRSEALAQEMKSAASPLAGSRAVAAKFQAELLTWLGLEVVAIFPPAEDPSPALLQNAIKAGREGKAALLVGNLQNGSRVPETLANALNIPCVMLSNFPIQAGPGAQEALMRQNLERLLEWNQTEVAKNSASGAK